MLYFKTNFGSIPHITPRLLNDIDPEHQFGLYLTYDVLKYDNITQTLNQFINDDRKILLGPSSPQITPIMQKSDVKVKTKNGFITVSHELWNKKLSQFNVRAIAPNPHPQKKNVTRNEFLTFLKFEGVDWVYNADWNDFSASSAVFSDDLELLRKLPSKEKYYFVENNLQNFKDAAQLEINIICDINDFYTNKEIMLKNDFQFHFVKNVKYEATCQVLDNECKNECCQYSKAYLRHLLNCHELTGWVLMQIHNVGVLSRYFNEQKE